MKHILLICNYYEGQTGNLEKCLESWNKCKNENTIVGFIDNGSNDNSHEIVRKYVENKFIDYYIFNTKNVGKAKALNSLFKYILIQHPEITENDLVYSIDSDIQILDDDVINKMNVFFENHKDVSLLSYKIVGEYEKYIYEDFDTSTIKIDDYDFYLVKQQNGIPGPLYIIPINVFTKVGLYNENLGKNHSSAIYGGDDAVLELKIYKTFPEMKNLICKSLSYFHPFIKNEDYKKWKFAQNDAMCKNGFGNKELAERGFYDK